MANTTLVDEMLKEINCSDFSALKHKIEQTKDTEFNKILRLLFKEFMSNHTTINEDKSALMTIGKGMITSLTYSLSTEETLSFIMDYKEKTHKMLNVLPFWNQTIPVGDKNYPKFNVHLHTANDFILVMDAISNNKFLTNFIIENSLLIGLMDNLIFTSENLQTECFEDIETTKNTLNKIIRYLRLKVHIEKDFMYGEMLMYMLFRFKNMIYGMKWGTIEDRKQFSVYYVSRVREIGQDL